jgi:DNA polymerase-3 subunit epsilon
MTLPFSLDRPLVCYDLETTTANRKLARIVEASFVRFEVDGTTKVYSTLVNPGIPIPPEATAIHGITDADVADAPSWKDIGPALLRAFHSPLGVYTCGYNVGYDNEVMKNECDRHGIWNELPPNQPRMRTIDAKLLWAHLEPRTLTDAVKRFVGRDHDGSHRGAADVKATLDVLNGMYHATVETSLPKTALELADLLSPVDPALATADGKLKFVPGGLALTFGKHEGVKLSEVDKGYLSWMARESSFSRDTKGHVESELRNRR